MKKPRVVSHQKSEGRLFHRLVEMQVQIHWVGFPACRKEGQREEKGGKNQKDQQFLEALAGTGKMDAAVQEQHTSDLSREPPEASTIMCGACGYLLNSLSSVYCPRCGIKLQAHTAWDPRWGNSKNSTDNIGTRCSIDLCRYSVRGYKFI